MTTTAQDDLTTDIQARPDGCIRVVLRGRLDAQTTVGCWNLLEPKLGAAKIKVLEVDAGGLQFCDGAGLGLLRFLNMGKMTPDATVSVTGLEASLEKIFRGFTAQDYQAFGVPSRKIKNSLPEEVGESVSLAAADLREQVAFLGDIVASVPPTLMDRKRMRWPEVRRVFELAGANAVPIVSLISVLVGLIIAFESAQPLAQFGAQIYVANMIGLVMVRELGPLLAAILLAGRSGSAFAAEIGTMKVNEELNALETLGLDPDAVFGGSAHHRRNSSDAAADVLRDLHGRAGRRPGHDEPGLSVDAGFSSTDIKHSLERCGFWRSQRRRVRRNCFRSWLPARIANPTRAERRRHFDHPRSRDQHPFDRHRGRRVLHSFLCVKKMSASQETIITVRDLKIGYGEKIILQNVNFQVQTRRSVRDPRRFRLRKKHVAEKSDRSLHAARR